MVGLFGTGKPAASGTGRWRLAVGGLTALLVVAAAAVPGAASASRRLSKGSGSSSVTAGGVAMPTGNLPEWEQVFADDFGTNVPLGRFPGQVSTKWSAYALGWKDTSKNGMYDPGRTVSIHDGTMDLYLHTVNGQPLVTAPVPRLGGPGPDGGLRYGRFAVRFRSDKLPSYKAAWMLWPDSDDWMDGEIDFPEGNLDKQIYAFMHHVSKPTEQHWFATNADYATWHTAVIEWRPGSVTFLFDGVSIGKVTEAAKVPTKPMHWVLQTETQVGGVKPAANVAGHVYIDWVAAYRYVG